jgi:hypothetical protein
MVKFHQLLSSNSAISTPWEAAFMINSLFKRKNKLYPHHEKEGTEEDLVSRYQQAIMDRRELNDSAL